MTLGRCNVGRGGVVRVMSGTWAVRYGPRKGSRIDYEFGEIGIQKQGADEQIPRSARREEDDACARDSVRDIPV